MKFIRLITKLKIMLKILDILKLPKSYFIIVVINLHLKWYLLDYISYIIYNTVENKHVIIIPHTRQILMIFGMLIFYKNRTTM